MTIDEAIKLLQKEVDTCDAKELPQWVGALQLGIEALKRHEWNRTHSFVKISKLLPMDEQKLNRKLAEWAGIPLNASVDFGIASDVDVYEPPDFTHSLDACFKWLVPKLDYLELKGSGNWSMKSVMVRLKRDSEPFYAQSDNPALALCLAIEKLIGG